MTPKLWTVPPALYKSSPPDSKTRNVLLLRGSLTGISGSRRIFLIINDKDD